MKLRLTLMLLVLTSVMVVAPAKAEDQAPVPDWKVLHVLNRLGFGPSPGQFAYVKAMGLQAYIDAQLAPDTIPVPDALSQALKALPALDETPDQLYFENAAPKPLKGQPPDREAEKAARLRANQVYEQAVLGRFTRAVESPCQLQEIMVDFWFNHFNVYADKGPGKLWVGTYENDIRHHAMGHFRDLLEVVAKHPAMLTYLDNWQNRKEGLNENFAREVMELHTLGVDDGYTQADVESLARILTGWGYAAPYSHIAGGFNFYFNPKRHDATDKIFLGKTIIGSGIGEGETALDLLAENPGTAKHLAFELAQYFVSDNPPPALVAALAKRYLQTDGDITQVLKTLFRTPAFWNPKTANAKFKTPFEYVISALRLTAVPMSHDKPIETTLNQWGQPQYECLTPDGYKNTQDAWLSPNAMTQRITFGMALATGRIPINDTRGIRVDANALSATLGNVFSKPTQTALDAAPADLRASMILGSPDFMRR
jgi:uncharacterized protein (DUF1800 family)